jgi:Fe-S cluster assembly protein SufD
MSQQRYQMLFETLKMSLPGHQTPWLANLRASAITAFLKTGFPTTRDEDWKYTSLRRVEEMIVERVSVLNILDFSPHASLSPLDNNQLIFKDGQFVPEQSSDLPSGVQLLATVMQADPQALEPFLNHLCAIEGASNAFAALNTAFMQNGVFVRVPANQTLTLHLRFQSTEKSTLAASHWRNLIVLEDNAHATVIESYVSDDKVVYLTNTVTEIFLGNHAKLTHCKQQNESRSAFHFGKIYVDQSHINSEFANHTLSLGAQLSRSDIHVGLKAAHTHCLLNGLYQLSGTQHADHHTTIDHQSPQGTSREFYKGTLDDKSRGVFNGKVLVRQDAQKTDSKQYNHNLLLSADAQIDTKPELEIFADDVKSLHGATVGQLDEKVIFYLRSRGLDEKTARETLIHAFFADVLARMPNNITLPSLKACQAPASAGVNSGGDGRGVGGEGL